MKVQQELMRHASIQTTKNVYGRAMTETKRRANSQVEYLDAGALQILLALDAEQKSQGRHLELANASTHLRQWFDYAGAADHFSMTSRKSDE
jgi:ABC-type transporter Mla MlaB component